MSDQIVSHTVEVAAAPSEIFALLQDPTRHAEIDGSGTVQQSRTESTQLTMGSKFGMDMKIGPVPYPIRNEVVEFEQDRLIAWRHLGHHRWRWELEPVAGGTRVTESFDWSTARAPFMYPIIGYDKKNSAAIEATLERLRERFAGSDDS